MCRPFSWKKLKPSSALVKLWTWSPNIVLVEEGIIHIPFVFLIKYKKWNVVVIPFIHFGLHEWDHATCYGRVFINIWIMPMPCNALCQCDGTPITMVLPHLLHTHDSIYWLTSQYTQFWTLKCLVQCTLECIIWFRNDLVLFLYSTWIWECGCGCL